MVSMYSIILANSYHYCEALSHCQIKHSTAAVLNVCHMLSQNRAYQVQPNITSTPALKTGECVPST